MNPADLSAALLTVVSGIVVRRGGTAELTVDDVALERPRNRDHGDWASNIAMKLAKSLGANPRELAQEIADAAAELEGVASVDVAGPGGSVVVSNAHGTVTGAAGGVLLRPFARLVSSTGDSVTTYGAPWNMN